MVKLTINLRSKWIFFVASGICLFLLMLNINGITSAIDIQFSQILMYYVLCILCAGLYWVPFQFNQEFT